MFQFAFVCVLACAPLLQADEPSSEQELERQQGTWTVLRFEREGQETPTETLKTIQRVVQGDHVVWKRAGRNFAGTRMVLDPSTEPMAIDLIPDGGPHRDQHVLGIYKFDGDELTICMADPDLERPDDFTSEPGSGRTLMVLRRQEE